MMPFALEVFFLRCYALILKAAAIILPVPTPLVFAGPGSRLQLCATIASSGVKNILIVSDATLNKLGLLDDMQAELAKRGVSYVVYDGIEPDPTVAQIEAGFAVLQDNNCEAVLAVGGGSPIDGAKVIAAMATNPKPILKMAGLMKVRKPLLPLYVVPTTAGTGSEVSVGAVVSDTVNKRKLVLADLTLVPKMACLDGEIYLGVPPAVTADTGMDALTHAVESYLSRNHFESSDKMALAAVRLIMVNLPRVYENGKDLEARQNMALAAHYAGIAMSKAGLGYVHAIAHNFGALYHVPHGRANAMVMPYVLEYSKPACTDRLAELARVSGLGEAGDSEAKLADRFIAKVREMNSSFGIPAQLEALQASDIPRITKAAMSEARQTYPVPRYMSSATMSRVVREIGTTA